MCGCLFGCVIGIFVIAFRFGIEKEEGVPGTKEKQDRIGIDRKKHADEGVGLGEGDETKRSTSTA